METDETENGNGKLKRKTETESGNEKTEIWKWSSEFNRLVSGQYAHRYIVVSMSRVTLSYMPNWLNKCGIIVVTASTSMLSSMISGPLAAAQHGGYSSSLVSLQLV